MCNDPKTLKISKKTQIWPKNLENPPKKRKSDQKIVKIAPKKNTNLFKITNCKKNANLVEKLLKIPQFYPKKRKLTQKSLKSTSLYVSKFTRNENDWIIFESKNIITKIL